jgi:cytochrome oxidase Cu insertion factor (SCO1/SenC/PrrC family)
MTVTTMLTLLWIVSGINLLLLIQLLRQLRPALTQPRTAPPIPTPPVGQPAPAFVANTIDDEMIDLADYAGRSLTLVHMSTHCPTCRTHLAEMPALHRLAQRAGAELVLVFFDEEPGTRDAVVRLLAELGIEAKTVLVAGDHPLQRTYNPRQATPFFFQIEDGVLLAAGAVGTAPWRAIPRRWQVSGDRPKAAAAPLA